MGGVFQFSAPSRVSAFASSTWAQAGRPWWIPFLRSPPVPQGGLWKVTELALSLGFNPYWLTGLGKQLLLSEPVSSQKWG